MRLFFALPLPKTATAVLGEWMEGRREVHWGNPEKAHLTLAFLGEIPAEALPRVVVCGAAVASRHPSFDLATAGLGVFPRAHGAQVVFLELAPSPPLLGLVADLRDALRRAEVPFDPKPYRPHLTLARIRGPLPPLAAPAPLAWSAEELRLQESHLEAAGARHVDRGRWPLGAPPHG
jgi:2'-5' RNA ligase